MLAAQTVESRLKPGESREQLFSLDAGQSTTLRITKTNADLQVVVKSGGEFVRELISSGYSAAPIRITLFAPKDSTYQIVVSLPAKTPAEAHYSLVLDPV